MNLHESSIFAWEKDKGFTVDIGIVSLGDRTVNQTVKLVGTADDGQWDAYLII